MSVNYDPIVPFFTTYGAASSSAPGFVTTGAQTFAGDKTFSGKVEIDGGSLTFGNATSNWVDMGAHGGGTPTLLTRSAGTKFVFYDQVNASNVDYASGFDTATGRIWWSVASNGGGLGFDFYAGTGVVFSINANGSTTATGPTNLAQYAKASLPTASSFTGSIVWCTDATGGACVAYSSGSAWLRIDTNAAV